MFFKKVKHFKKFIAIFWVGLSLLGYQPTIAFPPIKKVLTQANFTQESSITSASFNYPISLPHPGFLTTKFSRWHPGVDIAAGLGMPVHPITEGKVSQVNFSFFGLGNNVVLEHAQGLVATYAHLGRIFVKTGDRVTSSSIIGEVGITGKTSGPHTHLETTLNGQAIDPLTILPPISTTPTPIYQGGR